MASNNKPANTVRCGNIKATSVLLDDLLSPVQGSVRGLAQRDLVRSQ